MAKAPAKKATSTSPATKTPAQKAAATESETPTKKAVTPKPTKKTAGAAKTPTKKAAVSRQTTTTEKAATHDLAVRSDEKPWTESELSEVRDGLHSEAHRLRTEIHAAEVEIADLFRDGGEGAGHDQADVGSTTFERDHEMSLANHSREMLTQIEHALARIDDGSYGICENCGSAIGKLRLMAFPRATLCVSCKQRQERR